MRANVDAGPHEVAAQLDHSATQPAGRTGLRLQLGEVGADGTQSPGAARLGSTGCRSRRPGSAPSPATAHRRPGAPRVRRTVLRLADRFGAQVLRAGKQVKASNASPASATRAQQRRHLLGIDAELLGTAAHLHARALSSKSGFTRRATRAGRFSALAMGPGESTLHVTRR